MKNNSSKIIRALRKYFKINQINFSPLIGISQSALSKIETGTLELTALQWVVICEKFSIDTRSLYTGKIERLGDLKLTVMNSHSIGAFKIPRRYSYLTGSTVRSAYPLVRYMYLKLGEEKGDAFLRSVGFDPDYFIIMNNPLNLLFTQDLVQFLASSGLFSIRDIPKIIETISFKDVHSSIVSELSRVENMDLATKKLLERVKGAYELNTNYEFVGGKEFVVAKDEDHVSEYKLSAYFNNFRQIFNLSHFEALSKFIDPESDYRFESKSTSAGWIIIQVS